MTLTMSYDHMGRRREKNTQHFFYDGYLQIANFHFPTPTQNSNYYIWDCTESVATRPLAWFRDNSFGYYAHDGNKNVSEVMSTDGIIAAHYEYAPFGAVTTQRGESTTANPWRFSSEYAEDDTATVYYNYRHYDPIVGCWLSRDPIEEKGCKSLYLACCNDMLSRVDRLGRNPAALVTLDVLVAGALSAMSFVAIEISQNSTGLESLAGVLNEAISGLEVCLESVRKLAVEAGVAISEVVDELEKLRRQACEELNNVVQQTKKDVGSFHPAKCDCDMNCYELTKRKNAWLAEGVARAQRDVLCWDCGDEGHQQQQADVWQNFGRCFSFWVFKCSWR
jgi:RHS repeat-associated protein